MQFLLSEALCNDDAHFRQWDVTPEVIVVLLGNFNSDSITLQARNWEGKQLWQVNIAGNGSWGLAVGGDFVFLGSESGAINEFKISSG
jgi:hypothetical protein